MLKISKKNKLIIALILNVAIVAMEIIGIVKCINESGFWGLFKYYTEDSNIFLLITSVATCIYLILNLLNKKEMPKLARLIKYMSVCTVIETFLIVVFVLGFTTPTNEKGQSGHYQMLFVGSMLFHHFLCPVLSCISFLFFEGTEDHLFKFKDTLYAMAPTLVYGTIIIILNIAKVIVGPYPFLHIYEQTVFESIIYAILVLGCAYGITVMLYFLYNLINKNRTKETK